MALAAFMSFAATNMLLVLSNLGRSRRQFASSPQLAETADHCPVRLFVRDNCHKLRLVCFSLPLAY